MNNPVKNWRDAKKIKDLIGKSAVLIVWTKVTTPPLGFEYQAPYFAGLVETADKKRHPVQLVDCEEADLKTGAKLKLVVRRTQKPQANDVINYGIKAVPILK